jgi:hypothetical protein
MAAGGISVARASQLAASSSCRGEATLHHGLSRLFELLQKLYPTHLSTVGYNDDGTLSRTFSTNLVVAEFEPDKQRTPTAWTDKASIRATAHERPAKHTHPKELVWRILRRKVAS